MTDVDQMANCANYIKDDPFRRGLHFPVIEEALGALPTEFPAPTIAAREEPRHFLDLPATRDSARALRQAR